VRAQPADSFQALYAFVYRGSMPPGVVFPDAGFPIPVFAVGDIDKINLSYIIFYLLRPLKR